MRNKKRIILPLMSLAILGGLANPAIGQPLAIHEVKGNEVKGLFDNSQKIVLPTALTDYEKKYLPDVEVTRGQEGEEDTYEFTGGLYAQQCVTDDRGDIVAGNASDTENLTAFCAQIKKDFDSHEQYGYLAFYVSRMLNKNELDQTLTTSPNSTIANNSSKAFQIGSTNNYSWIVSRSELNLTGTGMESSFETLFNSYGGLGDSEKTYRVGIAYAYVNSASTLINGATKNLYYYVPNVPAIADILGGITAKDLFGKDCAVTCTDVEKAKYLGKIGVFNVSISASDTYGQTATATLSIHIIDSTAPVVTLKSGKVLSFVSGKSSLKAADLPSYFDITDAGTQYGGSIGSATYTYDGSAFTDKTFLATDYGTHKIGVKVTDSSGNTANINFNLTVTDGTAPEIARRDASGIETVVKIGLSRTFDLTKADFLSLFKATDDVDHDVSSRLAVDGSFVPNKVGSYTINLTCTDKSGNKSTASIPVSVIADIPPVFILSNVLVEATTEQVLTKADLTNIVTNGIYSDKIVTSCSVNDAAYRGNENKAGDYSIGYTVSYLSDSSTKSANGNSTTEISDSFVIRNKKATGSEEEKETHWYDWFVNGWKSFCDWLINGWQCLCNWLSNKGWFTDDQVKENEDKNDSTDTSDTAAE